MEHLFPKRYLKLSAFSQKCNTFVVVAAAWPVCLRTREPLRMKNRGSASCIVSGSFKKIGKIEDQIQTLIRSVERQRHVSICTMTVETRPLGRHVDTSRPFDWAHRVPVLVGGGFLITCEV
ncbi:hypothetical protein DPEC_G00114280 [Dallia pectoralis]|uniref:Uncharacterized protein n=1 Tax=Dallia pectoralis TaxID=75939 RepID=A0ACC2GU77_DALPE|nr:hypothetical protein DPEC_G00114280 [Dallia pectoralis]